LLDIHVHCIACIMLLKPQLGQQMLSRFSLNNSNKKMLAPHAVDIAVTISSLNASLCFTFAEPFDDISMTFFSSPSEVVHWSAEIQTKVYDPRIDRTTGRQSVWIRARSLNSYFAFCKIVVKMTVLAKLNYQPLFYCRHPNCLDYFTKVTKDVMLFSIFLLVVEISFKLDNRKFSNWCYSMGGHKKNGLISISFTHFGALIWPTFWPSFIKIW